MMRKFKFFDGFTENTYVFDDFDFTTVPVASAIRRLHAQWVPELDQDLHRYHNIDADAELTNLLSQQIAQEIDDEIMERLRGMNDEDVNEINENIIRDLTIRINGGQRA